MSVVSALMIRLSGIAVNVFSATLKVTTILSANPLRIAVHAEDKPSFAGEDDGFLGLFSFKYLYYYLKREVFIWATIITLCLLIAMMFVNKAEKLADRKKDVMHKLFIVFLASSTLFLLTSLIEVLDWIF